MQKTHPSHIWRHPFPMAKFGWDCQSQSFESCFHNFKGKYLDHDTKSYLKLYSQFTISERQRIPIVSIGKWKGKKPTARPSLKSKSYRQSSFSPALPFRKASTMYLGSRQNLSGCYQKIIMSTVVKSIHWDPCFVLKWYLESRDNTWDECRS